MGIRQQASLYSPLADSLLLPLLNPYPNLKAYYYPVTLSNCQRRIFMENNVGEDRSFSEKFSKLSWLKFPGKIKFTSPYTRNMPSTKFILDAIVIGKRSTIFTLGLALYHSAYSLKNIELYTLLLTEKQAYKWLLINSITSVTDNRCTKSP